jgi:hypothetical protein
MSVFLLFFLLVTHVSAVVVGAYSHKWLAEEARKAGIDPQSLADKVNADAAAAKAALTKKR